MKSRHERLEEFYRRMSAARPASTFEEAFNLLARTLNSVEDQLTDVPFDPENWQNDGRLYPPLHDSIRSVPEKPWMKRMRSKRHNTLISENGAIEIRTISGRTEFLKQGADGKGVWDE